jgi:hypothetical protein
MPIIREGKVGKAVVRVGTTARGYAAVVNEDGQRKFYEEGDDPNRLWMQAQDAAARLNPLFVGYEGARKRFLSFFPQGFKGADYIGHERAYKLDAKNKLDQAVPLEKALTGSGFGESVLSIYRATNLLFSIEKTRLQDLLRGRDADDFVRAAAMFASGDRVQGLREMKAILKRTDNAKWTVVTYLPFLWRPDTNVFLKPTMIQNFASRVGHRFADDYSAELDTRVYESLLELAAEVKRELADLEPQDMIDIQSFMWTAVEYTEQDKQDYQ